MKPLEISRITNFDSAVEKVEKSVYIKPERTFAVKNIKRPKHIMVEKRHNMGKILQHPTENVV